LFGRRGAGLSPPAARGPRRHHRRFGAGRVLFGGHSGRSFGGGGHGRPVVSNGALMACAASPTSPPRFPRRREPSHLCAALALTSPPVRRRSPATLLRAFSSAPGPGRTAGRPTRSTCPPPSWPPGAALRKRPSSSLRPPGAATPAAAAAACGGESPQRRTG